MTALHTPRAPGEDPPRRSERLTFTAPLYDLPELRGANDALLAAVAERLEAAGINRPSLANARARAWSRPTFGQVGACRYMKVLSRVVCPLASPLYRVAGAEGPFIRSAVVVRASDKADGLADLRGRRLAINPADLDSANLLRAEVATLAPGIAFFSAVFKRTGLAGAAGAVHEGEADAAPIDAVALGYLRRLRPELASGLRVLLWTARTPSPPFVATLALGPVAIAAIARALRDVGTDPALKSVRDALLIGGMEPIEEAEYRAVIHCQQIADSLGYPELE